jgi:hypothetical protein
VIAPPIRPWIEQAHNSTRSVCRADVRALESIADHASVSKIFHYCLTTVLTADHMIHFMRICRIILMNQAILATAMRALHD